MPSNACFANVNSIGVPRLRRVLRALAWLYPEIGYCQGTGMVSTAPRGLAGLGLLLKGLSRPPNGKSPRKSRTVASAVKAEPWGPEIRQSPSAARGGKSLEVFPKRLFLASLPRGNPCPHSHGGLGRSLLSLCPGRWLPASCCSWRRRMPSG